MEPQFPWRDANLQQAARDRRAPTYSGKFILFKNAL
jgi:hypothetical protein